jgi:2,3-bisphosphoglycerate-dependent phosphoglycerate mutase
MTTLSLARHGEAHINLAGVAGGDKTCTGLTGRGRDQARLLAARLRREQDDGTCFDVLYCAPRRRVVETAQILGAALGLAERVHPGLDGPRHGEADGRPWDQIIAEFGGTPQSAPDRPYAPGSESWNQYLARVGGSLSRLIAGHPGQHILIAGHGETTEAACHALMGLPPGSSARVGFASAHASLTRWSMRDPGPSRQPWTLTAFNDTRHLPAEGQASLR